MSTTKNTGTVRFFLENKGYGFIVDDKEVDEKGEFKQTFFHISGTLDKVVKDDKVTFEIEVGDRGPKGVKVARVKKPI